jgi:hypothetical protein
MNCKVDEIWQATAPVSNLPRVSCRFYERIDDDNDIGQNRMERFERNLILMWCLFLGFGRSLWLFLPTSLRLIFLCRVFRVDALFCLSPVLLFFETIPVYLHGGVFYGFSWLRWSLLTRGIHQSCSRRLSCWNCFPACVLVSVLAASWI